MNYYVSICEFEKLNPSTDWNKDIQFCEEMEITYSITYKSE